jgi:hypothetical protein
MSGRQLSTLLTLWTLYQTLPPGARAADTPTTPFPDPSAQMQTIRDLRSVGTAMYKWWKDEMAPRRSAEAHKRAEAFNEEAEKTTVTVDLSSIPALSKGELAKVLVPKYLDAVPEKDGWGNPYEFRLQTQDPEALHVMAVRSAGKGGQFSGTSYRIEEFPSSEPDQDLAWMDGYFIRWPRAGTN